MRYDSTWVFIQDFFTLSIKEEKEVQEIPPAEQLVLLVPFDEDITKMESRTTPIREGEDDEDIAMLDTPTPWSSLSCNSFPTQLPRRPRIQQTRRHCFGHNFLIRH